MCPPYHFAVKYRINPWMDPDAWATKASDLADVANLQWQALYEALVTRGAKVEIIQIGRAHV
jgi:N-dimethylarginine dimethylaminohydrolase